MYKLIKNVDPVIHAFDKFGEPAASLNIKGKETYKTRAGGLCGIVIFTLLFWFAVIRFQKMIQRGDPIIYQVE